MITCDEIIDVEAKFNDEETKTCLTNFSEGKATCKIQHFYILLAFLLITTALLIPASIYCYLRKYWAKHLLSFQITNNKPKKVMYQ